MITVLRINGYAGKQIQYFIFLVFYLDFFYYLKCIIVGETLP